MNEQRVKEKLTHKLWAKIVAFFLLGISTLSLLASGVGIFAAWEFDVYTSTPETLKSNQYRNMCLSPGDELIWWVRDELYNYAESRTRGTNAQYAVTDSKGKFLWQGEGYEALRKKTAYPYAYGFVYVIEEETVPYEAYENGPYMAESESVDAKETHTVIRYRRDYRDGEKLAENEYVVFAVVDTDFPLQDMFYWTGKLYDVLWAFRYAVYIIAALGLALALICFIFLMCAAGRRAGHEEPVPGYLHKIPFDLITAAVAALLLGAGALCVELGYIWSPSPGAAALSVCLIGLTIVASVLVFTGWCAGFAARVKLGQWWKNTLIFRVLRLLWRGLGFLWRGVRAVFRGVGELLQNLPLIWKTALGVVIAVGIDLIVMVGAFQGEGFFEFLWILGRMLLIPCVMFLALMLRKLQAGGRALAAGDLNYRVDTKRLVWDFKRHGENLNAISDGMSRAVEERLKSERLKTELITNVSHDIKTPLTSIVNYVDLLRRDPTPEQAEEYLEVLDRQSQKMKKLTEDLVELSKASTGNMQVELSRCDLRELLHQAAGEYNERFAAAGLEAVLDLRGNGLFVLADGTLLWRVVDNLFSNACKYALPGTRFYVEARPAGQRVLLAFKNISRERLNISADELMERFVRGDSARGGEGSGLGLNIAKSLTELQRGFFALSVDGDLFKAELSLLRAE